MAGLSRIAVVGAGITGLAAAYELRRRAGVDVVVLEAAERLGGKILTTTFAGRPVDAGADAFLTRVPAAAELCTEVGLGAELVSPAERAAYLFSRGELRALPDGLVLGVPTDLRAAERSGILAGPVVSAPGPALRPDEDVAVGTLVRARFGDEVATRLVDPLLGGINAGDSDRLSVRAAAPMLARAAEQGGDLAAALRASRPAERAGRREPVFLTLPGGLGRLVDTLASSVLSGPAAGPVAGPAAGLAAGMAAGRPGTRIERDAPVLALAPVGRAGVGPGGTPAGGWELTTPTGTLVADGVVLTVPAFAAAGLLDGVAPAAARLLAGGAYASVALVTLAFDDGALEGPLDASGFLVPRPEGLLLTACTWSSSKWAHLRDGPVLLRASAGRMGDDRALDLDDTDLVGQLLADLDVTMGVRGEPAGIRVTRWERSFPQYEPGHLARVAALEAELAARTPGVVVAGAAQRGLGLPACITQGRRAARAVLAVVPPA